MLDQDARDRAELAVETYESEQANLLPEDFSKRIGDGDYVAIGSEFLRLIVELGELSPEADVLDLGCGLGRIAQPLKFYLGSQARYVGVDVVKENVDWCSNHIVDDAGRFRFVHTDVHHPLYNPAAAMLPENVDLPFAAESFDFVLMISVFTHFSARMSTRYLSEVHRILRPGGRLFATFFLINDRTREAAGSNHRYPFDLSTHGPVFTPPEDPGYSAAAMDECWFTELFAETLGFRTFARRDGHWPDAVPAPGTPFQDILVLEK